MKLFSLLLLAASLVACVYSFDVSINHRGKFCGKPKVSLCCQEAGYQRLSYCFNGVAFCRTTSKFKEGE